MKKLSLTDLFETGLEYMMSEWKAMLMFMLLHIGFGVLGFEVLDGWHDFWFVFWLVGYYLLWYAFFRFYFNKKPYLFTKKVFSTVSPSIKIFALSIVVVTVLLLLPLLPPLFDREAEWAVIYLNYLQVYMEDSKVVDMVTVGILVFASPFIFYRPMMAWIASTLGRSSLLKTAYAKTKDNYWKMVIVGSGFNFVLAGLEYIGKDIGVGNWLLIVVGAPIMMLFNVVLAKSYEFFFLDIDS